jgi:tRNA threonylcarbamoyladenosine biosynthesis protein TsaB
MLTLAFDTSTTIGSVALGYGGQVLGASTLSVRARHSETIFREVSRLLFGAGIEPGEIDRLVVGSGPGSFTGVRIAASLAKGWCHRRDVPLYAYSSLRAVAATVEQPRVCVLFDARRGEVYAEAYDDGPFSEPVFGPLVCPVELILPQLDPSTVWVFAGEGSSRHRDRIEAGGAKVLSGDLKMPPAAGLLWLAERLPEGFQDDLDAWEPSYLRASGAERERDRSA